MDSTVSADETLYRAVKRSTPDAIDSKGNPTSALFKDDAGVSVDRDGGREATAVVQSFQARFQERYRGTATVGAGACLDCGAALIPDGEINEYHALIFDDGEKTPLTPLKARKIADAARLVDSKPEPRAEGPAPQAKEPAAVGA